MKCRDNLRVEIERLNRWYASLLQLVYNRDILSFHHDLSMTPHRSVCCPPFSEGSSSRRILYFCATPRTAMPRHAKNFSQPANSRQRKKQKQEKDSLAIPRIPSQTQPIRHQQNPRHIQPSQSTISISFSIHFAENRCPSTTGTPPLPFPVLFPDFPHIAHADTIHKSTRQQTEASTHHTGGDTRSGKDEGWGMVGEMISDGLEIQKERAREEMWSGAYRYLCTRTDDIVSSRLRSWMCISCISALVPRRLLSACC